MVDQLADREQLLVQASATLSRDPYQAIKHLDRVRMIIILHGQKCALDLFGTRAQFAPERAPSCRPPILTRLPSSISNKTTDNSRNAALLLLRPLAHEVPQLGRQRHTDLLKVGHR
jgi:hypothetical protein